MIFTLNSLPLLFQVSPRLLVIVCEEGGFSFWMGATKFNACGGGCNTDGCLWYRHILGRAQCSSSHSDAMYLRSLLWIQPGMSLVNILLW